MTGESVAGSFQGRSKGTVSGEKREVKLMMEAAKAQLEQSYRLCVCVCVCVCVCSRGESVRICMYEFRKDLLVQREKE